MIAIIDYGIGNLGSVKNAFDYLKIESVITNDKDVILNADKVILPGVGAFSDAINTFKKLGFDKVKTNYWKRIHQSLVYALVCNCYSKEALNMVFTRD